MKSLHYILITFLLFSGCGTVKKTEKESSQTTQSVERTRENDSVATENTHVVVNQGIKDEIRKQVPQSNTGDRKLDSLVNTKVDQILRQLNTRKSSGSNSYRSYFDEKTRELITEFEVGATRDSLVISTLQQVILNQEKTDYSEIFSSESKKVVARIPWWLWALAVWFFRKPILETLAFIFPQLRAIGILKRIINPFN